MIIFNAVTLLSRSLWFEANIFLLVLFFAAGVLSRIIVTLIRSEVLVVTVLHTPAHQQHHFPSDSENKCSDKE